MLMTITEANERLDKLKALQQIVADRRPGWDQTVRCQAVRLRYGDTERFLAAMIADQEEAIRLYYLNAIDAA